MAEEKNLEGMVEIEELYERWLEAPDKKKSMALLPLLEYGYPKGAELLNKKTTLAQKELVTLIEYALEWETGGGWSLLAIEWLENGFPINEKICGSLLTNSENKRKYSQNERHRAFKLAKRWKRGEQM